MKFISIGPNDAVLFDKLVKNKPAFVKFYSPFCIHCIENDSCLECAERATK